MTELRVTTLIDSLADGTAQRAAVEIACALDRTRYAPYVIASNGDGPLVELLERADVPHTILERRDALDVARWHRAHRSLTANADLLHSHAHSANARAALLARTARIPLVAHEHDAERHAAPARRTLRHRRVARRASRVLCTSEQIAAAERASGVPDPLIDVIPVGIHVADVLSRDAARAVLGLVDGSFTIGITDGIDAGNAHQQLLHAIARLAHAGRDVRLCIIGAGPARRDLQLLAGALGIAGRISWIGQRDDAERLTSAFDLGVATLHDERLTRPAINAMAARVALVATRPAPGIRTPLDDGSGLLVPTADNRALADAIGTLMTDPAHRDALAAAGARHITETYSFDAMLQRIERIYHDVTQEAA